MKVQQYKSNDEVTHLLGDEQEALRLVSEDGLRLKDVDAKVKNIRKVVLAAVRNNGSAFQYASKFLQEDNEIASIAIKSSIGKIKAILQEIREFRSIDPAAQDQRYFNQMGGAFASALSGDDLSLLLFNSECVFKLEVAEINFSALYKILDKRIQSNSKLALEVAKEIAGCLHETMKVPKIKDDCGFESLQPILLKKSGNETYIETLRSTLEKIVGLYGSDKALVKEVVSLYPQAFKCAAKSVQIDKEVLALAIKSTFVSMEFLDVSDQAAVDQALVDFDYVYDLVSEHYTEDKGIHWQLLKGLALFLKRIDVRKYSTEIFYQKFKLIFDKFKNDKRVALAIVNLNGALLPCVSSALRGDKEVVLTAIKNCALAIAFSSPELRKDKDFVLEAISFNAGVVQYARQFNTSPDFLLEAVLANHNVLQYIKVVHPHLYHRAFNILRSA